MSIEFLPFTDELAPYFETINVQWIRQMFVLEDVDKQVLQQPRKYIIDKGGKIWFAKHPKLGIVGACALLNKGDGNFELTKMDTQMYTEIQDLKDDEVSPVLQDEDRINEIKFKVLMVTNRIDEHDADFSKDYLKIKRLALQEKHLDAIAKWQDEKINDTYIKINGEHRKCNFTGNWLKN